MRINVPDSIRSLEPALADFINGMVHKLHVNSHKRALSEDDLPGLLSKMEEEVREFREQLQSSPSDMNVLAETWDASNFWFLIFAFLRQEGVATQRERFLDEYYDIQPELGRVFCVKKRSGSKYGPGDEVSGTPNRHGEALIRTQNAAGGFAVTVPRSHLIWWKAKGVWPIGTIARHNEIPDDDRIGNLFLYEDEEVEARYPYVSRYAPAGRENTANYGKFVYQRRHMFQLIRVGYWDTEAEAAAEGLKAWKTRVEHMQENKT